MKTNFPVPARILLWAGLLGLAACQPAPSVPDVGAFLNSHWQDPLPPQGAPPGDFTPLEASLAPEACASCHAEQHAQWRTALHSHAMGPGIYWQFPLLGQEEGNRCLRCHAPLAEQKALLARDQGWPRAPTTPPPAYVPEGLERQGLVCAACHVRGHVRFGPPAGSAPDGQVPHGGFVASEAFRDSRFCAHCHQFPDDGPRLAGKLREDTYRQWQASPYAGKQTCQDCHMPEGKHLWRGIHDPDMVNRALAVELRVEPVGDGEYRAEVVARNQGAGHHFPTYMVPKVYLVLSLTRPGRPDSELAREVIGWMADEAIEREAFDTRIPAGESRRYEHLFRPPDGAWEVELRVDVAPREHYERMFRHSLRQVTMPEASAAQLRTAIDEAVATRFTAMRVRAGP